MLPKASWIALFAVLALAAGCSKKAEPASAPASAPANTPQSAPAPAQAPAQAQTAPAHPATSRPKLVYSPKPLFPPTMYLLCREGEVCVSMLVSADGVPSEIKVSASDDPEFSNALLAVVPQWRFQAATRDGVPVAHTVTVAIPFYITNRPVDLPQFVSQGHAELFGVKRPAYTAHGAAHAVADFTLASDTIVSDVKIVESTGDFDKAKLIESLSQWSFIPARSNTSPAATSHVKAGITYTETGNVLIQYPYPTPVLPPEPVPSKP